MCSLGLSLGRVFASVVCGSMLALVACSSTGDTKTPSPVVAVGQACSSHSSCESGLCIAEARDGKNVSWTDGLCSRVCSTSTPCSTDTVCVPFDDGTSYCLSSCSSAGECRTGYVCVASIQACLPDCRLGFDCGSNLTCDEATGACILASGSGAIGDGCTLNIDCASALCAPQTKTSTGVGWTDGYCTQVCSDAAPCPDTATCVRYGDGSSYCAVTCSTSSDCRDGYVCSTAVETCLPDCRLGWSCGTTLSCDTNSGECVTPPVKQGTGKVGAKCASGTDCGSEFCIIEQSDTSGTGWSGGYCSLECSETNCVDGAVCVPFADQSSYCAASCAGNSDCRAGYVCSTAIDACLPDCRLGWSCGSLLICDQDSGVCTGKMLAIGEACNGDTDCSSGLCTIAQTTDNGTAWKDGYCTQSCGGAATCPDATSCVTYADGSAYCAAACGSDTDCRDGYVCVTSVRACLPDCRQGWSCGTSLACDTDTGWCG